MSGKSDVQLSIALDYGLYALVKRCNQPTIDILTELIQQTAKMLETRDYSRLNTVYKSAIDAMRKELGASEK